MLWGKLKHTEDFQLRFYSAEKEKLFYYFIQIDIVNLNPRKWIYRLQEFWKENPDHFHILSLESAWSEVEWERFQYVAIYLNYKWDGVSGVSSCPFLTSIFPRLLISKTPRSSGEQRTILWISSSSLASASTFLEKEKFSYPPVLVFLTNFDKWRSRWGSSPFILKFENWNCIRDREWAMVPIWFC
jgi:hypothetical protein